MRARACARSVTPSLCVYEVGGGGGAVKVMTERSLFTLRNPHFIALMNVNGCACTAPSVAG